MGINKISPTGFTVNLYIGLSDYPTFKGLWNNQKTLDFYVYNKQVYGDKVILSVRSMRINDFIKILNDFNIPFTLD